ncbi:MAG: hypothetical protein QXX55_00570 [Candidatus Pacearchaeota archaeon]
MVKNLINTVLVIVFLFFAMPFFSAIIINAEYVKLYSGEEANIIVNVENNENFDIESVSISLVLDNLPFSSVGSSERVLNNLNRNDEDSVKFILRSSTDIKPGDYNIPYIIRFVKAQNNSEKFEKRGSFGIRIGAKTDLDFSIEIRETAIVGKNAKISFEIINRGLGRVKSVSVQAIPNGFELLSANKIFIGTIEADDSDNAVFDVIFKNQNPTFSAKITYKDFDNQDQTEYVNIPIRVYTEEQALQLGLIKKNNTWLYILIIIIIVFFWFFWRLIMKKKKNKFFKASQIKI